MSIGIRGKHHPSRRTIAALLAGAASFAALRPASAETRTVTGEGDSVQLPAQPKRIVVLDAGLAGYLFALEAPVAAADVRFPDGRINRRTGFDRPERSILAHAIRW